MLKRTQNDILNFQILLNQLKQSVRNMYYVVLAFISGVVVDHFKWVLQNVGQVYMHLALLEAHSSTAGYLHVAPEENPE